MNDKGMGTKIDERMYQHRSNRELKKVGINEELSCTSFKEAY